MKRFVIVLFAIVSLCCNKSNDKISRSEMFGIINAIRKDNPGYFSGNYCSKFMKPDDGFINTDIFESQDTSFIRDAIQKWDTITIRANDLKLEKWEKLAISNESCYGLTFPLISKDRKVVILCSEAVGVEKYNECYRFKNGKWKPFDLGTVIY